MLQLSVVDEVSATFSVGTLITCGEPGADAARGGRSISSIVRPAAAAPSRSDASRAAIASTVGRASGPIEPAFRYAMRSRTGNSARASSKFTGSPARSGRGPRGACRFGVAARRARCAAATGDAPGRRCGRSTAPGPRTLRGAAPSPATLKSPPRTTVSPARANASTHATARSSSAPRGRARSPGELVACRFATTSGAPLPLAADDLADPPLLRPREAGDEVEPEPARLLAPEVRRVEHEDVARDGSQRRRRGGSRCPAPRRPSRRSPGASAVSRRPSSVGIGTGPSARRLGDVRDGVHPAPRRQRSGAPTREPPGAGRRRGGRRRRDRRSPRGTSAARADACARGRGSSSGSASGALLYERRARRPRRSRRVHAAVRPRARGRARAGGRRGRAPHVAVPLRRGAGAGRLPARARSSTP